MPTVEELKTQQKIDDVSENELADQSEREGEMVLHEKAQKIEWLDIGPSQDAEMFLVACGLKPATEIDVYRYKDGRDRGTLIKTARDIGLAIQEKDIAPHKNQNMEGTFVIAKDVEILKRLMQVEANADHREYGRLMGFPESAVDGFIDDDLLPDEEYPDMSGIVFHFQLSKERWKEEIKIMRQWSNILEKYMPDTYNNLLGNH